MKKIYFIICLVVMLCSSVFVVNAELNNSETINHKIKIGDYVILGRYNNEPILWRCIDIDENGPLMLSDEILCDRGFDERAPIRSPQNSSSHGKSFAYVSSSTGWQNHEYLSNYWGDSNIRCWLNSVSENVEYVCGNPLDDEAEASEAGFLSEHNFTASELKALKPVTLPNHYSPLWGLAFDEPKTGFFDIPGELFDHDGSIDTFNKTKHDSFPYILNTDRVFLLSVEQLYNAYTKNAFLKETLADSQKQWHLRTSYPDILNGYYGIGMLYLVPESACVYTSDSELKIMPKPVGNPYGIRPAFYLNENSIELNQGDGTYENPCTISSDSDCANEIIIDDKTIAWEAEPVIINDRVMAPLEQLCDALCIEASVNSEGFVNLKRGSIQVTLSGNEMNANGETIITDTPVVIQNDVCLVPVRAVCEMFGATVS